MSYQAVFKRYELKYLITREQKQVLLSLIPEHMVPDEYGRTTIRNLYFDTDSYRLIRRSLERPVYKEKLRIRSYQQVSCQDTVFVELKKKYDGVVYKRRLSLPEEDALRWVTHRGPCPQPGQISREIDYVLDYYRSLHPVVFLSYQREAFHGRLGDDVRLTFDEHILARQQELSLGCDLWGHPLLEEGLTLMEVKCPGAIPLWLVRFLSREGIRKTSFSKYGTAYNTLIRPNISFKGEICHA